MKNVKKICLSCILCTVFAGCANFNSLLPTKKSEVVATSKQPALNLQSKVIGNYVDDGYVKRAKGYDWTAVMVTPSGTQNIKITLRSRSDIKQPTCTFDAIAHPSMMKDKNGDILYEAKDGDTSILFTFSKDNLKISTPNEDDRYSLFYYCSGGATIGGDYAKYNGAIELK